jgi:hypothetical protein
MIYDLLLMIYYLVSFDQRFLPVSALSALRFPLCALLSALCSLRFALLIPRHAPTPFSKVGRALISVFFRFPVSGFRFPG